MSAGPDPQVDLQTIEQERQRLSRRLDEVARLCESDAPAPVFYGEMLKRLLESLAAPAGAVWARTAQGNLQVQFQINLKEVGLDRSEETRRAHEELLRLAVTRPGPMSLMPRSGLGPAEDGKPAPGNPTDFLLLIVPVLINDEVAGLIEVWQGPHRPQAAVAGFLKYMQLMADLCGRYQRHQMLGQMAGQQQLWTQLEAFSRQIHGSLHPTEVAYLVANEGRRLIACDRVTVAVRTGRRVVVEAVSGADVVEKRSNLVRCMRALCDHVIRWGEKLVFTGTKDDSLPPKVLEALDAYLSESPSKLLVVQPLKDEREGDDGKKPARTALLVECFEPPADGQQVVARVEVVGRHAAGALYNAVEYRRIPMRFLWLPLAKLQEGLGGKARAITTAVLVGLTLLVSALVLLPYPLKMDSTGQLLPQVRHYVFPRSEGRVLHFAVEPAENVRAEQRLAVLFDIQLDAKMRTLRSEFENARREMAEADNNYKAATLFADKQRFRAEAAKQQSLMEAKAKEFAKIVENTDANPDSGRYGEFFLKAPPFTPEEAGKVGNPVWTVLNANFKEELTDRTVKPSDPVLRLGAKDGPWEIELKIPQKHIGQVLAAFERLGANELDVDFLLRSDATRTFRGRLHRDRIAGEATPNRDDNNESEPVVLAYVRIDGDDIDPGSQVPREMLLSGTEVHAKVRCGNHRMGYSLFYGVWEFLYEKVVFFF